MANFAFGLMARHASQMMTAALIKGTIAAFRRICGSSNMYVKPFASQLDIWQLASICTANKDGKCLPQLLANDVVPNRHVRSLQQ